MKKIKIELLFENGKRKDSVELSYFMWMSKLIQIDGVFYVQRSPHIYQEARPDIYKTKQPSNEQASNTQSDTKIPE